MADDSEKYSDDEYVAEAQAGGEPPPKPTFDQQAFAYFQQMIPLQMACKEQLDLAEAMCEKQQDIRRRQLLRQQAIVWEVNVALLGSLQLLLGAVAEVRSKMDGVYKAMGLDKEKVVN